MLNFDEAAAVEAMARGMREAVIRDDEGEFPRLFDLLGFSGENKSHTVTNGLAKAALAALKPFMGGWRTMESAPKDGTWIMGWAERDSAPYRISWGTNHDNRLAWCTTFASFHDGYITHWMPLEPLPPSPDKGGE